MLTQSQVNNFRIRARQQGFSEIEIEREIARKQQDFAKTDLKTKTQKAPTKSAPIQNRPITQSPIQQPKQGGVSGAVDKVASFLIPRTMKAAKTVTDTFTMKKYEESFSKANENLYNQSMKLTQQAIREKDPVKKKALIARSKELTKMAEVNTDNFGSKIDQFQRTTGLEDGQGNLDYALRQSIGVGGEAASWVLPVGKLVKGARLLQGTNVVKKIIQSGVEAGVIGGIYNATDPNDLDFGERIEQTVKGAGASAVTGGVLRGGLETAKIPQKIVSNFVKGNQERINKLFRLTVDERRQFRKSTGNMDFAGEILKREAQDMAGKNYEELIEHFNNRADEAFNEVETIVKDSAKTINKSELINKIKAMQSSLAPEKGNVGQGTASKALGDILKDLESNPDQLTMSIANTIKRQLQNIGDSAFSTNGKATPQSEAIADLSTFVKDLIEKQVPEVTDANKTIQLYQAAKRSIERTGAREANKISNDLVQKFLQAIPVVVGGAGGIGAGGIQGGMMGLIAGSIVSGTVGNLRVKYFTPEVQTKIIKMFEQSAAKNKVKNPPEFANKIVAAIGDLIMGVGAQKTAQTQASGDGAMAAPQTAMVDSMLSDSNIKTLDEPMADEEQPQAPVDEEMITIRNKETGEERTVAKSQLAEYGLGEGGQDPSEPPIPTKKDILLAMILDMQQTGGKNLSKLNTLLAAYESVFEEEDKIALEKELNALEDGDGEDKDLSATEVNKVQLAQSGIRALDELETILKDDPNKVLKGALPGGLGARDYKSAASRAVEGLLRARTGAAITKEEVEHYIEANLPKVGDSDEEIQFKLNAFRKDLEALAENEY